jgi:hypothetical protein
MVVRGEDGDASLGVFRKKRWCDYQKLSIHVEGARDRRGWRCHVPLPPLSLSLPIGRKSTEPHTRRQSNALLACIGLRVLLREGSNRPAKNSSLSVLPHFISFFTALSLSPFSLSSRERERRTGRPFTAPIATKPYHYYSFFYTSQVVLHLHGRASNKIQYHA